MPATVHILPLRTVMPCRRCGGSRRVTFDQMNEAQQRWAPLGAIHPCPDCGEDAEIIPMLSSRREASSTELRHASGSVPAERTPHPGPLPQGEREQSGGVLTREIVKREAALARGRIVASDGFENVLALINAELNREERR